MNLPPQRHLFIVGFFRSGTSLLYSLLNLHPQIKLMFEADLLSNSLVTVSSLSGQKWWDRLDFYNSCIRRHNILPQPGWNKVRFARPAAEILYSEYGGSQVRYIGEKSPSYYNCLPALARQFPEARFIVIWRNPKDVISSILHAGQTQYFFSSRSLPLRSLLGFEQMQNDVLSLRAQGIPIFDLCYEDLIENPETMLKSVCEYLELPFDPQMLNLEKADCSMLPPGEHHTKVKSGEVSRTSRASEPALGHIQAKIERYLGRWQARFQDQLVTRRYWREAGGGFPNGLEVLGDRLSYFATRFYCEQFTPLIYGLVPFFLLRAYRRWRGKASGPASSSDTGAATSASVPKLKISVVTPSYKQLPWLKLCIASIADQKGVTVEHIIQDAQSGIELEEWVRKNSKAQLYVEADSGMYDAINRGLARTTGDIVCWLNSDEQYLEGTLAKVVHYFETHPEVEMLFGDALLVGNTGALLSYRRTTFPNKHHIQLSHLNVLSCALFARRSILERGHKLDTHWKAIADAVWIVDLLKAGIRMAVLNEPLSVFTITDKNLGQTSLAFAENEHWQRETLAGKLWLRPIIILLHRLNKFLRGAYWPRSISARLYTLGNPYQRTSQTASFLGFQWPH